MGKIEASAQGLIALLLDRSAPLAERDDAAVDLQLYDEDTVETALAQIACDPATDAILADSVGHSLAVIWVRKNRLQPSILLKMIPSSLAITLACLKGTNLATEASALSGRPV